MPHPKSIMGWSSRQRDFSFSVLPRRFVAHALGQVDFKPRLPQFTEPCLHGGNAASMVLAFQQHLSSCPEGQPGILAPLDGQRHKEPAQGRLCIPLPFQAVLLITLPGQPSVISITLNYKNIPYKCTNSSPACAHTQTHTHPHNRSQFN